MVVSSDAPGGGVTQPSGTGAGNPGSVGDGVDVAALVNEAVNKALGARLKRIDLEGQITRAVEAAIAKVPAQSAHTAQESTATPPAAGDGASDGKLSMKALQEQVSNLTKQLQAQQKAAQDAEQRARDVRARSEFQSRLAAKLGADHPMLGALMDSLYDVKKRVVEQDGRLAVKFVDQWGNEELKPLDEGVSALFDGELKPFVQQSKAGALPPAGFRAASGQPLRAQQIQQQTGLNPLDAELIEAVAKDRPELAATLAQQAQAARAPQK